VLAFVNEFEGRVGTYLYGRKLYEAMIYWETAHAEPGQPQLMLDFATAWQAADKVVYSTTLSLVSTGRTRLERAVGGPGLAACALRAGLIDEIHLLVAPVLVGAGKRVLPSDVQVGLELLDERRFRGGTVFLRYAVKR
jgi:dihydrofolate reductase